MKQKLHIVQKDYDRMVKEYSPNSKPVSALIRAFIVGGLICCLGQLLKDLALHSMGMEDKTAGTFVSVVLIFLAALLTGLGFYDEIGKFSGAGSIVPITGFSNSVVSPAMEYRSEGFVLGVGAKLFTVAGPVIAYGTLASVIYGVILWIAERI